MVDLFGEKGEEGAKCVRERERRERRQRAQERARDVKRSKPVNLRKTKRRFCSF